MKNGEKKEGGNEANKLSPEIKAIYPEFRPRMHVAKNLLQEEPDNLSPADIIVEMSDTSRGS